MKRPSEAFDQAFRYDPETGTLTRLFKGGTTRIAGAKRDKNGYVRVSLNGREYAAHRVIWRLVHGEFPTAFIDHINGIKSDNRWANLRLASDAQNKRNVGLRSHNKSGFKGVSFDKQTGRWMAHATLNGKGYNLGRFVDPADAAIAYKTFAKQNHGEFYRETNP